MRYFIPNRFTKILFFVVIAALFPALALAQDVPFPTNPQSLTDFLPWLISLSTPLLLGLLKKLLLVKTVQTMEDGSELVVYSLPAWFPKWLPMLINPALNLAQTWLLSLATGGDVSPVMVGILTMASAFFYNVYEQIFKVATGASSRVVKVDGLPDGIKGV